MDFSKRTSIGGKAQPGIDYEPVVLETYYQVKSGKSSCVHARPIEGQGKFLPEMDAECSRTMRRQHPVGTKFLVWAKIIDREGTGFVYTSWRWPEEIISE